MKTRELDYKFPNELIAEKPASPRDSARLMLIDQKKGSIKHSDFFHLDEFLKKGDVLIFNKSKVFPARVYGKNEKGKIVEVLFLEEVAPKTWEVIIGGRVNNGETIELGHGLTGTFRKNAIAYILVNKDKEKMFKYLNKYGQTPLPPYIKRKADKKDKLDYQNIFAEKVGSAAAPTAGLHFTNRLIKKLEKKGVQLEYVTLHVGLGTFAPVRTENLEDHNIHSEYYEIDAGTAKRLSSAKNEGRRIIACGTTSVRVLESAIKNKGIKAQRGHTRLFIYPGYKFKFIDGLITNFHTPKSSLLGLVYAFGGEDLIKNSYKEAISKKYRLFSYGDGMLIL